MIFLKATMPLVKRLLKYYFSSHAFLTIEFFYYLLIELIALMLEMQSNQQFTKPLKPFD